MTLRGVVDIEETIVAIGSSGMPASRGVVRLSGPDAVSIATRLGFEPRPIRSAHAIDSEIDLGDPLGKVPARALLWPSRRSYTGEPSLELHTFGSLPILNATVEAAIRCGARAARPGEFTLRAFLAGRLDLTQAEAVLGVIDAEGRGALDHALRQLSGNLSRPIDLLRNELLDLLADVEAGLDFVDEDIEFISDAHLSERLDVIADTIESTRRQMAVRSRDKSERIVALRGLPNAGKSQLLNALADRSAAIVADLAGTTRDVVSVPIQLEGVDLVLVDTAGIESSDGDPIELQIKRQAQLHADRAGREADVRIWCVDRSADDWETAVALMHAHAESKRRSAVDLWVATKCDLAGTDAVETPWIATSSETGLGIAVLRQAIGQSMDRLAESDSGSVAATAARCSGSLRAAETAIRSAIGYLAGGEGHEYVSSELRLAAHALGEVTGAVYTDDILDRVFSRFCIGK